MYAGKLPDGRGAKDVGVVVCCTDVVVGSESLGVVGGAGSTLAGIVDGVLE